MKREVFVFLLICVIALQYLTVGTVSQAQVGFLTKEELNEYTPLWKGERFTDGRPKVPDEILERMKNVTLEEAEGVLIEHGYFNQLEDGWVMTHENPVLVGRAHTAQFMPNRPDLYDGIRARGKKVGAQGPRSKFWQMDVLGKDDVPVIDMFGKIAQAAYVGDNLAHRVYEQTGSGIVVDGGCRDYEGIIKIKDFIVFNRGFHPSSSRGTMMCVSINSPVLIGKAVVMPGDVVLGRHEGVIFIPPHLAQEVVENAEMIHLRDQFEQHLYREGKYKTVDTHGKWADEIIQELKVWLEEQGEKLTPEQFESLIKGVSH